MTFVPEINLEPEFGRRLKTLFKGATNKEIGSQIGEKEGTVGNYIRGRVPGPQILSRIANVTQCNLNWLLLGEGEMHAGPRRLDLNEALRDMIRELIKEELDAAQSKKRLLVELPLGDKQKTRKAG